MLYFEKLAPVIEQFKKDIPDVGELPRLKSIVIRYIEDIDVFVNGQLNSVFSREEIETYLEETIRFYLNFQYTENTFVEGIAQDASAMIVSYMDKIKDYIKKENIEVSLDLQTRFTEYEMSVNFVRERMMEEALERMNRQNEYNEAVNTYTSTVEIHEGHEHDLSQGEKF